MKAPSRTDVPAAWTTDSLRQLVRLGAETTEVIVMANAEPFGHVTNPDGGVVVQHSTSGLVTAVEPLVRATSGVWIAHGSGSADRQTVELDDGLRVPPGAPRYRLRRLWFDEGEIRRYYDGFANEGLWPLCHRAHVRPVFRTEDFNTYREINRRFVEALQEEARSEAPIVLVQDYHLALAPMMIRVSLPLARIVAFWHVPWPAAQIFETCPWSRHLVEGLLGADILGFQTPGDRDNFRGTAARVLKDAVALEAQAATHGGHRTELRVYPASIEWPSRWSEGAPPVDACRRDVRETLRLSAHAPLSVSVGRLDYSKGIEETFAAVERLLERHPEYRGVFTHVQLAAPTRARIPAYQEYAQHVRDAADRVNRRFGTARHRPIMLLEQTHQPPDVQRILRAADVCYVGSLHDGMNLVAKEFVAARDDEHGALVLSVFTGAAWQLTDALIVNPYDLDAVAATILCGLTMDKAEQRERMRRLRRIVADENAHTWAGQILSDVAGVRDSRDAPVSDT